MEKNNKKEKALLIAVSGISGSGKSTLSKQLQELLSSNGDVEWVSNDVVRKELWGIPVTETLPKEAYSREFSDEKDAEVYRRIHEALQKGKTVIADGVFVSEKKREGLEQVANDEGAEFVGIWIDAPAETMRARADARTGDPSDAKSDIVDLMLTFNLGNITWSRINGGGTMEDTLQQALSVLQHDNDNSCEEKVIRKGNTPKP